MVVTSRKEARKWPAVVAAMAYLAVFLATCYGLFALAIDEPFLDAFATAFPRIFGAAALFYLGGCVLDASRRHKAALRESMSGQVELTHR